MKTGSDYSEGAIMQCLTLSTRIHLSVLWSLPSLSFGYVVGGGAWMVFWCGLQLATVCVDSRATWEGLWCRPRSSAAYVLPRATWYELQSDLKKVATYAWLGGAWERLS